jgi:hypothetical protein
MPRQLHELRERLLRAGVAPRHVRRYLAELSDHLADLTAEEQRNGQPRADAESAALARLGNAEHLAQAMISQPQLRAWSARAPWAAFGLVPIAVLAAAYAAAMLILWTGWQWFLPNVNTPFGNHTTGLANAYFQLGRALYFTAPLFIGWAISVIAARQRISPWWPAIGLALIAWLGATARVRVHRPDGALGHVGMSLSVQNLPSSLLSALVVLAVMALPWVVWQGRKLQTILSTPANPTSDVR